MENFYCPKTGKKFFISVYKTKIRDGKAVYTDNVGNVLKNEENGEELLQIEKEIDWDKVNFTIGIGNDKDGRKRRSEQLKKRSSDHFKKEILEQKVEKNRKFVEESKNMFKK